MVREPGIFLCILGKRKPIVYITMWRTPRSYEYRSFPYKEEVKLMSPRSWGYPPYWEGENHVVMSLCVMHKIFLYRNMCRDHARTRRICQYAYPSVNVIHSLSMKHVSIGLVWVRLLGHQERALSRWYNLTLSFCWCRVRGSGRTSLETDGSFGDWCRRLIVSVTYSLLTVSIVKNSFHISKSILIKYYVWQACTNNLPTWTKLFDQNISPS